MTQKKKTTRTDMRTYLDVFRLKYENRLTNRQIALALNIGRSTVSDLLARFTPLNVGWPLPADYPLSQLDNVLLPGRDYQTRRVLPDWLRIDIELKNKVVTKQLLWQEYQAEHGRAALGYTQFCEHYRRWKGHQRRSMRQEHKAGEKLFIDFCGPTIAVINPSTGEIRRAAIFVATMGASNYTYIEACEGQDMASWLTANSRCLEFLGGVPSLLIPDNLKSAVNKADIFEPELNDSYQALGRHYGCPILPARPYKPKDKGKVEAAVLVAERWVMARLRHHVFHTMAALNQAIRALNKDLNQRPMKHYGGLSRAELFARIDAPALQPLPLYPYEYTQYKVAKVAKDYHVQFDFHWYSVPHMLVGERVEIHATQSLIKIACKGEIVTQHVRSAQRYRHTTESAHMPPAHAAHREWSPERIRSWANRIGPNTAGIVHTIEQGKEHIEQAQRACLGLLSLQRRYGEERLERACGMALEQQCTRQQFIKNLLKNGYDQQVPDTTHRAATPVTHTNIRGPRYYQ
jgi:transposase